MTGRSWKYGAAVLVAIIVHTLWTHDTAKATPRSHWVAVLATWYGPGFYGNRTACGKTYTPNLRGTAHRTLPCGHLVHLCHRHRCVTVPIVDRGPYSAATFDLTARTAEDLCRCTRPYTMTLAWKTA